MRKQTGRERSETPDEKGRRGGGTFFPFMLQVLSRVSSFHAHAAASALLILACAGLGSQLKSVGNAAAGQGTAVVDSLPVAPLRAVTDDYYDTKVVDPYRYMESLNDPEMQAWMKSQNDYTRAVLARIPDRQQLLARIRELDQSVPQVEAERLPGDLYLIGKQLPGEDVPKLYLRRGLTGQDKLLVDPEKVTLAPADQGKGKNVITGSAVSNNGEYIALGIVPGGDELHGELHVIDAATGRETGDVITQVGAEAWHPNWLPDNRFFVYGRLQKTAARRARRGSEAEVSVLPPCLGNRPRKGSASVRLRCGTIH